MCTYIYTYHKDCGHRQYQNTFKCLSARGSVLHQASRSLTLDKTVHLPEAEPRKVPDPMCDEASKRATRPVMGQCRDVGAQRNTDTATGVRSSILGLEQLMAATKPLDLEE
ncbi:hypothetical protein CCHL11_04177 [Colletotrichum chlorophyti]|uniref:Uncharacterized protein n=1 Tax=Colletotrichum chlorophyti TaxID=708187 RepID=A0A1Q8RPD9_9PEZI|nr:hypothetical protein CCHL11_04177 [Colletotrichum chlorophyti]